MQISSFSIPSSIPMEKSRLSPAGKAATDQAVMNVSPDSFSSFVQEAGQMPEVRSELVDSFKSRINAGQYPTPETISGLTDLIGGSIVKQANLSSSSLES